MVIELALAWVLDFSTQNGNSVGVVIIYVITLSGFKYN